MDSGTSGGSMQSGSSGEDDQNDTSFSPSPLSIPSLNHHHHQNLQAQAQTQAQAHTHLHQQPLFSSQHLHLYPPLTNTTRDDHHMINPYQHQQPVSSHNSFLETLPQSDLDRIWSMGLNSHPQSHHQQQQQHDNQQQQMFYSASASSSAMNNPSQQDPQQKVQPTGKLTTQPGKENGSLSTGRVVKKRTRASRKTPTTVLTTDTTNFRAMVQEFTGIPTPPFGPSPLFPAKKFDLFNPNNNGLDPSLGSLLYSLNKANNNNNPNPNPFAPPPPLITTTASLSTNPNPYHQQQQQQSQSQQMMMMMPSGSNSNLLYTNLLPRGHQNQNPNLAFQQSSLRPSKYSCNEQVEVDHQLQTGYSKGENDNFSGTG